MSSAVEAHLAQQDLPAGGDRGLRELELAHVALREVHVVGQHEDALLADLRHPSAAGAISPPSRRYEAAGVVEQPGAAPSRPRSRRAPSRRCRPARRRRSPRARARRPRDPHALDRAVGGAHAAADLRGLERRAGRRRRGHHALARAERDLAVGADVDEQPHPLVARRPRWRACPRRCRRRRTRRATGTRPPARAGAQHPEHEPGDTRSGGPAPTSHQYPAGRAVTFQREHRPSACRDDTSVGTTVSGVAPCSEFRTCDPLTPERRPPRRPLGRRPLLTPFRRDQSKNLTPFADISQSQQQLAPG